MSILLNQFGDCSSDILGTGSGTCDIKSFGDLRSVLLLNKGFFLTLATDTLDEATYKTQLKTLVAFPLNKIFNFEQPTPENEKNTSSTGEMTEIRAGKPQFSFSFDRGSYFHKVLYDKRGKSRWDIALIFETGILFATNQDDTKLIGFDGGMLSIETFKLLQGTDPEISTAMLQLLNADQFNRKNVFFTFDKLGFNANDVDGVLETVLTYPTAPAAGTTFSVNVVSASNSEEVITGLDDVTKWRLGGAQASATTISTVTFNVTTNNYDFVVTPTTVTSDTLQLELFDTALTLTVVEDSIGELFKGKAPLVTL